MRKSLQSGYVALITIIIIGAVAVVIALFLLFTALNTSQTSLSNVQSAQAKAAANSCAELALAAIQANINLITPASGNQTLDATTKITCSYTITGLSPNFSIAAVGAADAAGANVVRRLTVTTNQVSPQLNVNSWVETQ